MTRKRKRTDSEDVQKVLGILTLITIVVVGAVLGWRRWGPGAGEGAEGPAPTPILVLAAASLGEPLQAAAELYEQGHPGWSVQQNLAASNILRHQIERGAPADLYLSAAPEHVDALLQPGWVRPEEVFDLWTTDLVVVGPSGSTPAPDVVAALAGEGRIAVGDLGVPVGDYAREAFQDLGLAEALHSRLVPMVNEPAVLNAVAGGACERGVAYATGSLRQGEAVTVLATFPADSHRPIHYKGCILADADHPRAAQAFLDFVTGGEGAALLQAAGLRAPTAPLYDD